MKYKGMWLDGKPNQQPSNTTRKNKNFIVGEQFGSWTNEKGFLKIRDFSMFPIGVIPLNRNDFVVFSTDETLSEIGLINQDNSYSSLISNNQLGFKTSHPIHGEFFINDKGERVIAYTDNNKTPKVLNIDNIPSSFTNGKIELFNYATSPNLTTYLEELGNLLTGTYYIILQYVRDDNSTSNWFKNYNPVYITDSRYSTSYKNYSGSEPNLYSNKSIKLNISNTNLNYKYVRIGYIHQANEIKTAYKIKDILITGSSINTIITGEELKEVIELDSVIIDKAIYKTVGHLTNYRETLYGLDVSTYTEPNQQSLVNNLTFNWYSQLIDPLNANSFKQSAKYHEFNNTQRSFAHDEVYALYIRFKYNWGFGKWWNCIGRTSTGNEKANSSYERDIVNGVTKYYKNYQVSDTCTLIGNYLAGREGTFSYWENENEVYPNEPYYPSGNVRHFKFPSMNWMRENVYNEFYGTLFLDVLGIKINNLNLSLFKDSDGNDAVGYEIGYAQRDNNNNRVVAQTLGIKSWFRTINTGKTELISLGGNWSTFALGYSELGASSYERYIRTYPFEMLYTKNSIKANRFRLEYKVTDNAGFVNKRKINTTRFATSNDGSIDSHSKVVGIDFTNAANESAVTSDTLYEILSQEYVPANVIYDNKNNIFGEEHYLLKYTSVSPILANLENFNTEVDTLNLSTNALFTEENALFTLLNISTDYYYDFRKQNIINTGHQSNVGFVNLIFGGDSYIVDNSFNAYGVNLNDGYTNKYSLQSFEESNDERDDKWNGIRSFHRYLCESRFNINLRYINKSNKTYTTYYPNTDEFDKSLFLHIMERDNDPNNFVQGYSKDYHAQNTLGYNKIFDYQISETSRKPFRIIRSLPLDKEFDINNWRDWRQNDYFEITKSKGFAKNIEANGNFIYIHFEKELYRTVGREKLEIAGKNVFVGYGDIFESEPEPIIYDEKGYLGTQHKWSCLSTEFGYLFFDAEKSTWWLIGKQVKPISSEGLYSFFNNVSKPLLDNPFTAYGIISSLDERYKRILITFKNKVLKSQYQNKFKGIWKDEQNFLNSLVSGDIVIKDNKYMVIQ
jgi:hypothetical protein